MTASLEHPNIIRIYDVGIDGGQPYFTMELIKGSTLDVWASRERPNLHQCLEVVSELCDAVAYAHEREVLHLDLKPQNVHMGEFGEIVLTDWGISHFLQRDEGVGASGVSAYVRGTPGFMAPEQSDVGASPTERVDVYGLGAILYFLLMGGALKRDLDLKDYLQAAKKDVLEGVSFGDIPESVIAILRKALVADAGVRYESVGALRKDLQDYLNGFAPSAESASWGKQLRLFYLRNRIVCRVVLGAMVAVVLLTVGYVNFLRQSESEAQRQRLAAEASEHIAREALEKFKQERSARLESKEVHSRQMVESSFAYLRRHLYLRSTQLAELAYEENIENVEARRLLARLYFIRFRFADALPLFEELPDGQDTELLEVCQRYVETGRPSVREVQSIYDGLWKGYEEIVMHSFLAHSRMNFSRESKDLMLKYMLERINNREDVDLVFNKKSKVLDLTRNGDLYRIWVHSGVDSDELWKFYHGFFILISVPAKKVLVDDTVENRHHYGVYSATTQVEVEYH
ncbi:serine/threonine protein kinase [Rubritalea tangerina]|uniref:Serine/threonine protein kinase n=1 Tax=Rubritalea tangerina TaxID=430798 RepID=A0ABW4ZF64_9BACT